ncbi:unnamed protein product, partial [Arctogadus glacialis]
HFGILSVFRVGQTKRGRSFVKCCKKAGRFPHLQLVRMVDEASGTHHKVVCRHHHLTCVSSRVDHRIFTPFISLNWGLISVRMNEWHS